MPRVTGIDTSLTNTGIAMLGGNTNMLRKIGSSAPKTDRNPRTGKPLPATLQQRYDRIDLLASKIVNLPISYDSDLVVIEYPSYASKTGQAHERTGLWWKVVTLLREVGMPVTEVSPSTRPIYATGKGTSGKYEVLAAVTKRYPDFEFTDDNEADALVLAMMGMRHLGQPLDDPLPQTHLRAMDKVVWEVTWG